jgi:hypothetical protein
VKDPGYKPRRDAFSGLYPGSFATIWRRPEAAARHASSPFLLFSFSPFLLFSCSCVVPFARSRSAPSTLAIQLLQSTGTSPRLLLPVCWWRAHSRLDRDRVRDRDSTGLRRSPGATDLASSANRPHRIRRIHHPKARPPGFRTSMRRRSGRHSHPSELAQFCQHPPAASSARPVRDLVYGRSRRDTGVVQSK